MAAGALIALWPMTGLAVGSEDGSTVPTTSPGTETHGPVKWHHWFEDAHGGSEGGGADPDGWNSFAIGGTAHVTLSGMGTADEGAEGCSAGGGEDSTSLKMPSMGVGSDTAPEPFTSLGGVVNVPASFWVEGYSGEEGRSPKDAHITIVNCTVSGTPPNQTTNRTEQDYRSWITFSPSGAPQWSFGDGGRDTGYRPGSHKFEVSSGRCVLGARTCVDVPGRGQVYVVSFSIPITVVYHSSPGDDIVDPRTEIRFRAFPVREVESILTR